MADLSEQQFWNELEGIVSSACATHESIDDALRGWLYHVARHRDQYLGEEEDVASCSEKLLASPVFYENRDYVRTQIIYSLLQEDETSPLHVIANFLLLDGRSDESVFRRMIDEGCFARLLELVKGCRDSDRRLHRLLLELIYEMSRIEHLLPGDLMHVDDAFVVYLFELIEALSDDASDPYHYPVIRVLLVLNEQYMVAATMNAVDPTSPTAPSAPITNRVIKVLSVYGPMFRTFGENLILLLNRETETALQLLILKLLYLLFTTRATYEYFYTNDLRVLLDVIIRNLLDLPNELVSLRHTYLRVMYPLLAHTQLSQPPHYKREEIVKVLHILGGSGSAHFAPADETTTRLVDRVSKVSWLEEEDSPLADSDIARKFLGISLTRSETASSVSVVDIAAVTEKPGVQTPSRKVEFGPHLKDDHEAIELAAAADEKVKEAEYHAHMAKEAEHHAHVLKEAEQHAHGMKPKRVLPEVPKHRHGVPVRQTNVHINGLGHGGIVQKKLPPKAPPRRRTKLKSVTSSSEAAAAASEVPDAARAPSPIS